MMNVLSYFLGLILLATGQLEPRKAPSASSEARFYEMRVYTAHPGKRDALLERFRRHTVRLFERHDIDTVGHWIPTDNPDLLYYVVSYTSRDVREEAWEGFLNDPDWKSAYAASTAHGPLVANIESIFLELTDYSVPVKQDTKIASPRFFELRTYTAAPQKLNALHARFRNHTVDIFTRHGMENVGYWKLTDADQGAEDKLLYILAYADEASRNQAWADFRADPAWIEAKTASEQEGKLVASVASVFMTPTDYSPIN